MMRRAAGWALVGLALHVAAVPVLAAGEDPVFSPLGTLFRWINSAIVIGALVWVIAKFAPRAFQRRREAIVAAINEAGRVKEEADRRLREAERKLAGLEREIAGLRETAERERVAEMERIRAATDAEIAKINRAVQAEIAVAERAARMELKAAAARVAVERAEALIRQRLNPEAQTRLIRAFVKDLAGSAN
jgi:F-type H+-transporting ATPase subunit b